MTENTVMYSFNLKISSSSCFFGKKKCICKYNVLRWTKAVKCPWRSWTYCTNILLEELLKMINHSSELWIHFLINLLTANCNTNKNILSKNKELKCCQKLQDFCLFQIMFSYNVNNLSNWKGSSQVWMLNTSLRGVLATYTQVLLAGTLAACWQELQRSTFASPQTTCLWLGLLACNLRQSSRSEVERVWLYVCDFDSHLSQCFAPWAAWVPQSCNSLRSSAARGCEIQKVDRSNFKLRPNSVIFNAFLSS